MTIFNYLIALAEFLAIAITGGVLVGILLILRTEAYEKSQSR